MGAVLFDRIDVGEGRHQVHVFCTGSHCVFGWVNREWVLAMLAWGFVIGFLCITGFNYAISEIPPLVFSAVNLIDPFVTGLLSWVVGIEGVPDVGIWIGGAFVVVGVFLISQGVHQREQGEDAKQEEGDENLLMKQNVGIPSNKTDLVDDDYSENETKIEWENNSGEGNNMFEMVKTVSNSLLGSSGGSSSRQGFQLVPSDEAS